MSSYRPATPDPGSTPRSDALTIIRAALGGVDPARLVANALADDPEVERWSHQLAGGVRAVAAGEGGSLPEAGGRTVMVSVGKAALGMARGALQILGDTVDEGVVLVPHGTGEDRPRWLPPQLALRHGSHPVPDEEGVEAAREVASLAGRLVEGDRFLVLLSGGGSALLTLPRPGLPLEDLRRVTALMLKSGAPIQELNRVRSCLEELKGGGLARWGSKARILGLVLSDVVGDDPGVVASGPLSPTRATARDTEILLRRRGLWEEIPVAARETIRTSGVPDERDASVGLRGAPLVRLVGTGRTALDAAAAAARRLGYDTRILSHSLEGEARAAGRGLAKAGLAVQDGLVEIRAPACLLAAGETTVRVRGPGKGGRNQEVALGAALALEGGQGILVASVGTDGVDGPTDAAGALADGSTVARARRNGKEVAAALRANDAYPLLDELGDLVRTGPTGTNVADLMLVLVSDGHTWVPG